MMWLFLIAAALLIISGATLAVAARLRGLDIWVIPLLCDRYRKRHWAGLGTSTSPESDDAKLHVFIAICDHFEPKWGNADAAVQRRRMRRWSDDYPRLATEFRDSLGRTPKQSFFYPEEEYEPEYLDALTRLRARGFGDVEIHLHHDDDTSIALRVKLAAFRDVLHTRHGLLRKDERGRVVYGFIHGNWALDNSHPSGRHCGVNDELTILRETGCYADFTMPAAPSRCQTRTVNRIYYAIDDPSRPKSHDRGVTAQVGEPWPEGLLMIQGPLAISWRDPIWGFVPRIENGDLNARQHPSVARLVEWCRAGVVVEGRPNWRFVKLHTHGCQEANMNVLLGEPMRAFHASLADFANTRPGFKYYYVTAWEMAQLVELARRGANSTEIDALLANPALGLGDATSSARAHSTLGDTDSSTRLTTT